LSETIRASLKSSGVLSLTLFRLSSRPRKSAEEASMGESETRFDSNIELAFCSFCNPPASVSEFLEIGDFADLIDPAFDESASDAIESLDPVKIFFANKIVR
jgi:hypothetical protein